MTSNVEFLATTPLPFDPSAFSASMKPHGRSVRTTRKMGVMDNHSVREGRRMRAPGAGCCRLRKWSWLVESVRGERWDDFIGRHGDYGRDLALHIGRLKCGLTLRELGKEAGGMTVPCVAKACERMVKRLKTDRTMQRIYAKVMKKINYQGG